MSGRLLIRLLVVANTLALAACGSSAGGSSSDGGSSTDASADADGRRFVLAGDNIAGSNPGFDVNTARIVADGQNHPDADFYLSLTMIVSLFGSTPDAGFCLRGSGLARVEDVDVPADLTSCTFRLIDLGGNAPHADSRHAGEGYLVRDRVGALGGKLLVISDRVDDGGRAEVTFDFLRL